MKAFYVGSWERDSGKTLLCYGIMRMARERGRRVGYLKPLGEEYSLVGDARIDSDVLFMDQALGLDDPPAVASPVVPGHEFGERVRPPGDTGALDRVAESFRVISAGKDLVLVDGTGDLATGCALGLDGRAVINRLGVPALLILSYHETEMLDRALWVRQALGERLLGVIVNRVPRPHLNLVRDTYAPWLAGSGIRLFGILPSDETLHAISVGGLIHYLAGEVLAGGEHLENLVERVVVGAMNVESALKFFRRSRNKVVITGGDRADLQIAALETSTRCLILTGGLHPTGVVLSKAQEAGVPVILVRDDTFTTVEKVEEIMGRLHIHGQEKLERAARLFAADLDFDGLWGAFGA
jgi:BioD-like phosphotransacetylase family protein